MKFIHRLGYYLGGFAIGLIFLMFFLSGKKTSCDYGPEARVLKNISTKTTVYTETAQDQMAQWRLDTTALNRTLRNGDVNFKASNTELDSCKVYVIQGDGDQEAITLKVKNCETQAIVFDIEVN